MSTFDVSQISGLSDLELVNLLTANGLPSGPITGTTRMVFEKLLRTRLMSRNGKCDKIDGGEDEQVLMGKAKNNYGRLGRSEATDQEALNTSVETENGVFYYGVCCTGVDASGDGCKQKPDKPLVFNSQELALEAVKNRKGSRFKAFKSRGEAENFSLSEALSGDVAKDISKLKVSSEPVSIFKSPTPRDIIAFRRAIENDSVTDIKERAFSNPRYLISSGETPVILQEGSRYNAMHVAVRSNKLAVCELIVNILSENRFWNLLFSETTDIANDILSIRKQRMIDLYLNTPDKVACETPLHMAVKNGFVEIVEYLKSFSSLVTDFKNKHGETPTEVICSRYSGTSHDEVYEQISSILEGRTYVPVYRLEDGSSLPYIGKPVAQAIQSPSSSSEEATSNQSSPLNFKYVVKAYAGPMSPQKASALYEKWVRSPKERDWARVTREDFDKGLERIGRKLTRDGEVPWTEYWSFLGSFEDLSSTKGLKKLERHLTDRKEAIRSHIIQIYSTPQRYQKSMRRPYSPAIARVREMEVSPGRRQTDKGAQCSRGSFAKQTDPKSDIKKKLFAEPADAPCDLDQTTEENKENKEGGNGNSKGELRFKLVRQEAYTDTKNTGLARLKLANLRSLSAGDAEMEKKCHSEGIPLKYSFDLEESFRDIALDSSDAGRCGHNVTPKNITQRKQFSQFPSRACSDVSEIVSAISDRQSTQWQRTSPLSHAQVCTPKSSPKKEELKSDLCTPPKPYSTPSPSPRLSSVLTPATEREEVDKIEIPLFIEGLQPTKTDLDVLRAIDGADVDFRDYPAIWKWMHLVNSYSGENQQSWPSPGSPRYRSRVFDKSPIWSC